MSNWDVFGLKQHTASSNIRRTRLFDFMRSIGHGMPGMHWVTFISSDEELEGPMKDQSLSADASPTTLSPGYIANSDPEEDKEDPEEDPADHPADG
ncbi:hypothetical protein Tco_0769438 [Tanacetum coccineum]|uniref:Uncharacterized protein n=1 Tax=Tanacetum coccineum TaxID=301880 RepID=A0ABQ4ZCV1_9ASTR